MRVDRLAQYRVDYSLVDTQGGCWRGENGREVLIDELPFGVAASTRITRNQYVYFMSADDQFFKVGVARNPDQRLRELQTGCPYKLRINGTTSLSPQGVDAVMLEREIHTLLAWDRMSGEWFNSSGEALARALKEAFVKLYCPPLYHRWNRFRLHVCGPKRRASQK